MEVGDRVYHLRKNDPIAVEGYCRILEIGPLKSLVLFEYNDKEGIVDTKDLITEGEAEKEGRV